MICHSANLIDVGVKIVSDQRKLIRHSKMNIASNIVEKLHKFGADKVVEKPYGQFGEELFCSRFGIKRTHNLNKDRTSS